jgi:HK97 family phage major capsid protein
VSKLNALLSERGKLVREARTFVDEAEARGDWTSEDEGRYESISGEIRKLDGRIRAEREVENFEGEHVLGSETQRENAEAADRRETTPADEYRVAFEAYLRGDMSPEQAKTLRAGYVAEEGRDMVKSTANKGGYISPQEFDKSLRARVEEFSVIRPLVDVMTTPDGTKITFTQEDARGAAAWIDEGGAFTATDDTFVQYDIEAFKAGRLVKVSVELVDDSMFDIMSYLAKSAGESLAVLEDAAIVDGDGTLKPYGFMQNALNGVTSTEAAADLCSGDELIDLMYSVRPTYRNRGQWVVADLAVKALRKLKDSNGQYIWQDGLRAGEPTVLLGKPVTVEVNMPTPGVSEKPIAFGDFSRYLYRQVEGTRVARLGERYLADEGKIGYLVWRRVDGSLLDTAAVKTLTQAAA